MLALGDLSNLLLVQKQTKKKHIISFHFQRIYIFPYFRHLPILTLFNVNAFQFCHFQFLVPFYTLPPSQLFSLSKMWKQNLNIFPFVDSPLVLSLILSTTLSMMSSLAGRRRRRGHKFAISKLKSIEKYVPSQFQFRQPGDSGLANKPCFWRICSRGDFMRHLRPINIFFFNMKLKFVWQDWLSDCCRRLSFSIYS